MFHFDKKKNQIQSIFQLRCCVGWKTNLNKIGKNGEHECIFYESHTLLIIILKLANNEKK